jgi:hypothetical protein
VSLTKKTALFLSETKKHQHVRSLEISNGWTDLGNPHRQDITPAMIRQFEVVLSVCINLTELSINFIELSDSLVCSITSIPCLRIIAFKRLFLNDHNVRLHLRQGSFPISKTSLWKLQNNYTFRFTWDVVTLFPQMRWLAIVNKINNRRVPLPNQEQYSHLKSFHCVERLSLCPLDNKNENRFSEFCGWIKSTIERKPPPLKHVAIATCDPMPKPQREMLIGAFIGTRLKTLTLGDL